MRCFSLVSGYTIADRVMEEIRVSLSGQMIFYCGFSADSVKIYSILK